MNPDYIWLSDAIAAVTFFVVGPILAVGIAYRARRTKPQDFSPKRYGILCAGSGLAAVLLLEFVQWMNADVRTPQYFGQLACVLLSGLLFGVCMGCCFLLILHVWRWHQASRLGQRKSLN
jgi:hypothetical protein